MRFFCTPSAFSPQSFAIGILSGISLKLAGTIYIGEILSMLYLFTWIKTVAGLSKIIPKSFIWFIIIWVIAQLFSDIVNNSNVLDSLKGIGAPIVLLLSTLGLVSFFLAKNERLPSFLIGLPLGLLLDLIVFNPTQYFLTNNQWKWGYGNTLASLIIVFTSFFLPRKSYFSAITFSLLSILAGIGLANDSRGAFGLLIIYAFYLLAKTTPFFAGLNLLSNNVRNGATVLITIIFFFALALNFSLGVVLTQTPISSFLPAATYEKTVKQAKSSLGLLAGGRSEFFASTQAFLDKPFLGHGSWAQDPSGFYNLLRIQRAVDFGEDLDSDVQVLQISRQEIMLIPFHSFLMGNLVWAGVFSGFFWIYVLFLMAHIYIRFHATLNFYFFHGIFALSWNIFFSPFSYTTRFSTAVFLASLFSFVVFSSVTVKNSRSLPYL